MDLSDILTNPLFIPLLIAIITIISNAVFLYWLRRWQYKAEYIISNVQKTYIPILHEINNELDHLNTFLEHPTRLKSTFQNLEATKKSGLFEFVRSHDVRLYQKLTLFHDQIIPKFEELGRFQEKTKQAIRAEWVGYIKNIVSDTHAREYANMFVNEVLTDYMFIELLNGRTERFAKVWNEKMDQMSSSYDLFVLELSGKRVSAFNASEGEIPKLIQLSQAKLKKLRNTYNQTKHLVDEEVVRGLAPMMQKYITNPLS